MMSQKEDDREMLIPCQCPTIDLSSMPCSDESGKARIVFICPPQIQNS